MQTLLPAKSFAYLALALQLVSQSLLAFNMPQPKPFLADSNYSMAHTDTVQQDALAQAQPAQPSRALTPGTLQYAHTTPECFNISTCGTYGDGERIFWDNGLVRIVKLDYDTHEEMAEYFFPGVEHYSASQADTAIAKFDDSNEGVAGYSAAVVSHRPRNIPWYLPQQAGSPLVRYLGSNPNQQPDGVQKFAWDAQAVDFGNAWVKTAMNFPRAVPIAAVGSNTTYLIGVRDNQWTPEALDWDTGTSRFHYVLDGQRYNALFAGTLKDMDGPLHYATL